MARVLVVESSLGELGRPMYQALHRELHDVDWCPGPKAPDYTCSGVRAEGCPFALRADVVILDMWLDSDVERRGVPSWHLLHYYRDLGLPVVVLMGPDGLPDPARDDEVVTLPRDATAQEIAGAVRSLLAGDRAERRVIGEPARRIAGHG